VIRPIRTAKPASEELTAAVQWYERQRAGLGREFFDAILGTIDRISETPDAGSSFKTLDARRMLVAGFPYQIVYRISADEIRILAFAHLRRRPGFWRHRR
jgi:plasmid stabilization system protein ParE